MWILSKKQNNSLSVRRYHWFWVWSFICGELYSFYSKIFVLLFRVLFQLLYYDTLYVTFAEGEAMNAVMAYVQKFIRDNKYYQYKYMEKDKTKPYKDDRKQRKVVYSSHIKLVR